MRIKTSAHKYTAAIIACILAFTFVPTANAATRSYNTVNGIVDCVTQPVKEITVERPGTWWWLPDKAHFTGPYPDGKYAYTYDNHGEKWRPTVKCGVTRILATSGKYLPGGPGRYDIVCKTGVPNSGKCTINGEKV